MAEKKWRAWPDSGVPSGDADIAEADSLAELLDDLKTKIPHMLVEEMKSDENATIVIAYTEQ